MLIGFDENPDLLTPITQDKKDFSQDLLFLDVTGGNTALLDAIYFALQKIKDESGRKIIVVCSDGEDTASYLRFDEVMSNLIASDVTVLAFGTLALSSNSLRGRYILEKLAAASGGYAFFPSSLSELDEVMGKLRQGMRSQYSLGYVPLKPDADGTWRKIEIQPKRAGLKFRYREGYYAN
jgi:VWFA-related protein